MSTHVRSQYLQWRDGGPELRQEIDRHLGECGACRRYYEEMDRLLDPGLLADQPKLSPDPFLPERIAALSAARRRQADEAGRRGFALSFQGAAFVVAVVIGILAGINVSDEGRPEDIDEIVVLCRQAVHDDDLPMHFEEVLDQSERGAE